MGATIFNHIVYIEPRLLEKIDAREKRVLMLHERCHDMNQDRIRIIMFMLCMGIVTFLAFFNGYTAIGVVLMLIFLPAVQAYQRHLEYVADVYAIAISRDYDAFISLMDKLEHNGTTHPGKAERIELAEQMRTENERR